MNKTVLHSKRSFEHWALEREAELMRGDAEPRRHCPKKYPCIIVWERTTAPGFPPKLYAVTMYSDDIPPLPHDGRFTEVATALELAKQEHSELVAVYFEERASDIERLVREEVFHSMMHLGKGKFDPVYIRQVVNMEFSP